MAKVLIACEESQAVCIEFRKLGHEAFSCDILPCSGGHPEWHFNDDVFKVINGGFLETQNGERHYIETWDLMIGHPPCTFISYAGNRWLNIERYGDKAIERMKKRDEAIEFFLALWNAPIERICLENPRGYIQKKLRHTQAIHPYFFGDSCSKYTLLWLKNLPPLEHFECDTLFGDTKTHVHKGEMTKSGAGSEELFGVHTLSLSKEDRSRLRSKTFHGIAKQMASQWGALF